jgi:hypothetical protein
MKNVTRYLLIATQVMALWLPLNAQKRYLDEIFTSDQIKPRSISYAESKSQGGALTAIEGWLKERGLENQDLFNLMLNRRETMLYLPPKDVSLRPLLLVVRGDPLNFSGNYEVKTRWLCEQMARRGFVVASIDFRFRPIDADVFYQTHYSAVQNAIAVLRYFSAHQTEYAIDPDRVFLAGIGFGSMVALHAQGWDLANYYHPEYLQELETRNGCLDCLGDQTENPLQVKAVINISGGAIDTSNFTLPVISFHGENDEIVDPWLAELMAEKIENWKETSSFSSILKSLGLGVKEYPVQMPMIFGSAAFHDFLEAKGIKNELSIFPHTNHNLLLSRQGTPKTTAQSILRESTAFLYSFLQDTAILQGPKETKSRCSVYEGNPNAFENRWMVEGGKIIDSSKAHIKIKWDREVWVHKVSVVCINTLGAESEPKSMEVILTPVDYSGVWNFLWLFLSTCILFFVVKKTLKHLVKRTESNPRKA